MNNYNNQQKQQRLGIEVSNAQFCFDAKRTLMIGIHPSAIVAKNFFQSNIWVFDGILPHRGSSDAPISVKVISQKGIIRDCLVLHYAYCIVCNSAIANH